MLQARGAVTVGRRGTVRPDKAPRGEMTRLERAAHAALYGSTGFRMLLVRPPVERELKQLNGRLVAARLLHPYWGVARVALCAVPILGAAWLANGGWTPLTIAVVTALVLVTGGLWLLPHRTRAAGRMLRTLGEQHPLPAENGDSTNQQPYDLGMTLAIHGPAALPKPAATFVRDAGLFGRKWVGDDWAGDGPAPENELVIQAFIAGDYGSGGGNGPW
jgi:uncharacterized protein (TIGR04222 family)